jgi:hypothetical protein
MPRYRLTTVNGQKFIVESQDDHESVVKEMLATGFLFGTREDSTSDTEAVLAGNVISVAVIAGTQLFTLPEFNFTPPQKNPPAAKNVSSTPKAVSAPKKAPPKPTQKSAKKKPKR